MSFEAGPNAARDEDLFSSVGLILPNAVPPKTSDFTTRGQDVPGTPFRVYNNPYLRQALPAEADAETVQIPLTLEGVPGTVLRTTSPACLAFMNASIRSFFRRDRHLHQAADHLLRQDLLYLGDLVRLSEFAFIHRLGAYAGLATEFEHELAHVGLAIGSDARWWKRPRDYYRQSL